MAPPPSLFSIRALVAAVASACLLSAQVSGKIENGVAVLMGSAVNEVTPVRVVTPEGSCSGRDATPVVPGTPTFSGLNKWVVEYVGDVVVICGSDQGNDNQGATASVCLQKPFGGLWNFDEPLAPARSGAASAVVGGQMYVLGGKVAGPIPFAYDVERREAVSEFYNPWKRLQYSMPIPSAYSCAAALDDTHLILMGGLAQAGTGNMDRFLADVFILDVTTELWLPAEPLQKPMRDMACLNTEYKGQKGVMVTGGCYSAGSSQGFNFCKEFYNDVSFFSLETQSWDHDLPKTIMTHESHFMTHIGGWPAVIDQNIEVFDGESWVELMSPSDDFSGPFAEDEGPRYNGLVVPRDVPDTVVNC